MSPPQSTTPPGRPEPDPELPAQEQDLAERILIQVDEAYLDQVDAGDLAAAIAAALEAEGRPAAEVTLVVTHDGGVQEFNRQYRGLDEPTDVLSFPAQDFAPGFVSAPEAADLMGAYLGDIIIALPFTLRQAEALGRPLRDELRLLAVHGTLHLLGYDHAEPEEEARMWARQDAILARLGP